MRKTLIKSLTIAPIALLTACGGGGGGGLFDDTTGSSNLNPASITISATKPLVQTNGTDSTTLTVTVKNSGSLGLADIPVEIRKDGDIGNLTVAAATTDANGQVTATLTGDSSYSNGIVTISARVTGTALSASAPIVFNGSTLTVNSDVISAQVGSRSTLIYTVKNATESGIYNTPVCLDFDAALIRAEGALTQTSNCANAILTDINGSASVDLVGLATGSSVVRATASGEAVSTTVSLTTPDITFTSPSGAGTDTAAFDAGLPVSVRVPGYTGVVRLATSLGTWDGVNNVIEVTASGESASATLRPGNMQGKANITATKLSGGSITSTSVFFYDTSSLANATIKLEATPNVLTAGADGTSSQLVATVMKRDGSGAITVPAVNAPVSFRIMQSAGGTEYIAAAYDETDTSGQAISQFFAGSTASAAGGVVVEACVVGQPVPCSEAAITLTQKSGSITIGNSTTVTPIADNTAYEWPISVLVTDINGTTPVKNATVSLSVWPVEFRTGCWDDEAEAVVACASPVIIDAWYPNEDVNMNVWRDSPDTNSTGFAQPRIRCDLAEIGSTVSPVTDPSCPLLPPNAAASLGASRVVTATTDNNGLATFKLTYLKDYSRFTRVRVIASTEVQGSKLRTSQEFVLTYAKGDKKYLGPSPFNAYFTPWP